MAVWLWGENIGSDPICWHTQLMHILGPLHEFRVCQIHSSSPCRHRVFFLHGVEIQSPEFLSLLQLEIFNFTPLPLLLLTAGRVQQKNYSWHSSPTYLKGLYKCSFIPSVLLEVVIFIILISQIIELRHREAKGFVLVRN